MNIYTLDPGPRWAFMLVHEEGDAHNVDVTYTARSVSRQLVEYNLDTSEPEFHAEEREEIELCEFEPDPDLDDLADAPMVPQPPPRERIDVNIPLQTIQYNVYLMGFCRDVLRTTERVQNECGIIQMDYAWIRQYRDGWYCQGKRKDDMLELLLAQHRNMLLPPAPPGPREGLSSGCLLYPAVTMAFLLAGREHPCDRCNHGRSICLGFPPLTPDPMQNYCP